MAQLCTSAERCVDCVSVGVVGTIIGDLPTDAETPVAPYSRRRVPLQSAATAACSDGRSAADVVRGINKYRRLCGSAHEESGEAPASGSRHSLHNHEHSPGENIEKSLVITVHRHADCASTAIAGDRQWLHFRFLLPGSAQKKDALRRVRKPLTTQGTAVDDVRGQSAGRRWSVNGFLIGERMVALGRFAEEQLFVMFYTDKAISWEALTERRKRLE